MGLGDLPGGEAYSTATAVSANGLFITGCSHGPDGFEAVLWSPNAKPMRLGDLPGGAFKSWGFGVSNDGRVVVGEAAGAGGSVAFFWTPAQGMRPLLPAGGAGAGPSIAFGTTPDAQAVVGVLGSSSMEAFRWTPSSGAAGLGDLPGGAFSSTARSVSANGLAVVGSSAGLLGNEAFLWTVAASEALPATPHGPFALVLHAAPAPPNPGSGQMISLGELPGGKHGSDAWGVSPDGTAVVGGSISAVGEPEAFRWTQATGMIGLGLLPGGLDDSIALGTSKGGTVVVGRAGAATGLTAFVWTAGAGMRGLRGVLTQGGANLDGWQLSIAHAISADGRIIVGIGTHNGASEAWVARIPAYCGADCNADGVLTTADLGCYQTRYVTGDLLYADCTGDGALSVQDWSCFQSAFVSGCP